MLCTLAHRLRNDLTVITGHCELLRAMEADDAHRASLITIEQTARRMARALAQHDCALRKLVPVTELGGKPVEPPLSDVRQGANVEYQKTTAAVIGEVLTPETTRMPSFWKMLRIPQFSGK